MSVSIVTCPQCKSLLLSDTVQCPSCHHVLNPNQAVDLTGFKLHSEVMGSGSDDIPCPDCGEMVRKELVRCWRCGGFLRSEMAETYQRMRDNAPTPAPAAPALRDVSSSKPSAASKPALAPSVLMPIVSDADDDDFALGPGVTAIAPGQSRPPQPATDSDADGTYRLPEFADSPSASATADASKSPAAPEADASAESHSVATAGDVLFDIARQEEQESDDRRKTRGKRKPGGLVTARTGFIIFCPYGHQIEVQEKHRGQMGRCPRCKAQFIVPLASFEQKPAEPTAPAADAAATAAETAGTLSAGKFARWMKDVRLHLLDPTKLKLKPGSLENAFELVDLGFGLDGLLLITLVKKGSLFGSTDKKKPEIRDAVVNHLTAGKPLTELQVASQRLFNAAIVKQQIQVVQPVIYAHESMFAGIPVFGVNRIAVRLPKPPDGNELLFASFWLSEFREFTKQMDEVFEINALGEDMGIPLVDKFAEHKCHYTETMFQVLENAAYYQADPGIKLQIAGRKCEGCGLLVSEAGRKREKLGGADGKGIAKAKCSKCQKKFGSFTFYMLDVVPSEPPAATAPAAAESPASS